MIRCDYCHRTQDQVDAIIQGPEGHAICSYCVALCLEILVEKALPKGTVLKVPAPPAPVSQEASPRG